MGMEVAAADVVRCVLQFLRESGLQSSYEALAAESQVALNSVDNVQSFTNDIASGRWESVLPVVAHMRLPDGKLAALYEQVVLELAEMRELDTARAHLRQAGGPLCAGDGEDGEAARRSERLERILAAPYFDAHAVYGATSRDKRRRRLADSLASEVFVAPPSRLMCLIGQAFKWQQYHGLLPPGSEFDLFRESAPVRSEENDRPPQVMARKIDFGKAAHPESAVFSPDGSMLVTGSADGFVEVWDHATGKLKKDLAYQAEDAFMMHGDGQAVISMAVSRDSEMLATGGRDGKIKVWKLKTGKCLRRFEAAHAEGVSAVSFSRDGSQILSCSFDATVRVHGLKSGKLLKEFRGHNGYVNDAMYCSDANRIASASSDGAVKLWDARTTECVKTFRPPGAEGGDAPVIRVLACPKNLDQMVVCTRGRGAFLCNDQGLVVRSFSFGVERPTVSGKDDAAAGGGGGAPNIITCELSPRGDFLYCIDRAGRLHALNTSTGESEATLLCHEGRTPYGLAHHPHRNLVATFASDASLRTWTP